MLEVLRTSVAFLLPLGAAAALDPCLPDEHTLHLWHFDESMPPFIDATTASQPLHLSGLHQGAQAGAPSIEGLGKSIRFPPFLSDAPWGSNVRGPIVTASPLLTSSPADNVAADFQYFGAEGAFTFEALVRFEMPPAESGARACGIISMDGEGHDRIFNFRVEKEGFLSFIQLPDGGGSGLALATIPRTGPHALEVGTWFHAAVTYDGNEGIPNNLRLYWTRVDACDTAANWIGSGTLPADLSGITGDFAIGNEARAFADNAESEPFPGSIDEVRISSIARQPDDFLCVPAENRKPAEYALVAEEKSASSGSNGLRIAGLLIDGIPTPVPQLGETPLRLPSGLHRLDFDFGFTGDFPGQTQKLRSQLEGFDDRWVETARGMRLVCQALDRSERIVSQTIFPFMGKSAGWVSDFSDSTLSRRNEPLHLPADTHQVRLILSSGSADTTGLVAINHLSLTLPESPGSSLWSDGSINLSETNYRAADTPAGWTRNGTDPAVARLVFPAGGSMLALVDGDQGHYGEWIATQRIDLPDGHNGVFSLAWDEAFNVSGGNLHRATFINVPPGSYQFKVVGLAGDVGSRGDLLTLGIEIAPPFWQQTWFAPTLAASIVALFASLLFVSWKRRNARRLEMLRYQNALEMDRTRIARDLHDDLGSRVTHLALTADLARRAVPHDPDKARRHLDKMSAAARNLVAAMDDMVWAVDPAHDTLDHLASHLMRQTEEMLQDSPVRYRFDIPAVLPPRPLATDHRHHLALAVKEAIHNVLQHAGPCDAVISLSYESDLLQIQVSDNGKGFVSSTPGPGRGMSNIPARIEAIGGTCEIHSSPGQGTSIRITCRLPEKPLFPDS